MRLRKDGKEKFMSDLLKTLKSPNLASESLCKLNPYLDTYFAFSKRLGAILSFLGHILKTN